MYFLLRLVLTWVTTLSRTLLKSDQTTKYDFYRVLVQSLPCNLVSQSLTYFIYRDLTDAQVAADHFMGRSLLLWLLLPN